MHRNGKRALVGTLLLALGATLLWMFVFSETRTEKLYRKHVHIGVRLQEVEAVLGPGERMLGPLLLNHGDGDIRPALRGNKFYCWYLDGGRIWVGVKDERVVDTYLWVPEL